MYLYRKTWAEIDLSAIKHNITEMKKRLLNETKIFAVVKADGYGHGAVQVAETALEAGANYLAVALLEEALELREAGIEAPILVFGYVGPEGAIIAAKNNITLTVFHREWLEELDDSPFEEKLNIHLKVDTGMGRLGLRKKEEIDRFLEVLSNKQNVLLSGVYTHFATADDLKSEIYIKQKETFNQLIIYMKKNVQEELLVHTSNSAATIREPEEAYDAIRFGIAMYGLYPSSSIEKLKAINLRPAFSLHSQLTHVKKVEKGSSIGYGASYIAKEDEWIGTIPIGYADGWRRSLQGFNVLVNGRRCKIVGRICMDQLMIRLDQNYKIGTKVTLIGVQNGEEITADEVAEKIGTINYEIPCMISHRVPRLYS